MASVAGVVLTAGAIACSSGSPVVGDASPPPTHHDGGGPPLMGHDATTPTDTSFPPLPDAGSDSGLPAEDGGCTLPTNSVDAGARVAELESVLATWTATFEAEHSADGGFVCPAKSSGLYVRDLTNYALATLTLGRPNAAQNATVAVECAFDQYQETGPDAGASSGLFYYRTTDLGASPATHSTELVLQPLPALLATGKLDPAVVLALEPKITAALRAIERTSVPITYTSMWLTEAMELSLLGALATNAADAGADSGTDAALLDAARDASRDSVGDSAITGRDGSTADATAADGATEAATGDGSSDGRTDAPEDAAPPLGFAQEGAARLAAWIAFTRGAGVSEFESPTAYATDLDSLWVGYQFGNADQQPTFAAILRTFWEDISANTFIAHGGLSAPYSQVGDFFRTHGDLETALYLEGLRLGRPVSWNLSTADFETVYPLLNATGAGFHPDRQTLCLSQGPRTVQSLYASSPDAATDRQRYVYFTRDLALGSASADYVLGTLTATDQLIQGELASFDMPVITVLPDWLDSPGVIPAGVKLAAPVHLALHPAAAQENGAMLVLLYIDAEDPGYTGVDGGPFHIVNLSTNIMFPSGADEVWTNGGDIDASAPEALAITPTLVVRQGAAAIAVRVLSTSNLECPVSNVARDLDSGAHAEYAPWESFADASTQNVGRIALYHTATGYIPKDTAWLGLGPCFARAALLFVAEDCQLPGCVDALAAKVNAAEVTNAWNPFTGVWDVSARAPTPDGGTVSLRVTRAILGDAGPPTRLVNDASVRFVPLEMNGGALPIGQ